MWNHPMRPGNSRDPREADYLPKLPFTVGTYPGLGSGRVEAHGKSPEFHDS